MGEVFSARGGTLEYFLTERYCLYTTDGRGRIIRGEIHHPPWPLQDAEAEFTRNTMAEALRIALISLPLLHFARRQDVLFCCAKGCCTCRFLFAHHISDLKLAGI